MPNVDGMAAHTTLLTFAPLSQRSACLMYVWQAYAAHGATSENTYPDAYSAWKATTSRHTDRNPLPGRPIWLGRRSSDGNMFGDVFIAGKFDGDHAATDYPGWYDVSRCTIQARMNQTGREYLGWSDDFLGNWITGPGAEPDNAEEEDIMRPILLQLDPNVDGRWVVVNYDRGTYWAVHNGWQLDRIREDDNVRVLAGAQPIDVVSGLIQLAALGASRHHPQYDADSD